MSEATPRPWEFDGDNPSNQGFDIALPDGGTLATAYYDVNRDPFSVQQAEANALLIVRAVNSFDALADACLEARVVITRLRRGQPEEIDVDHFEATVLAALALARK